MESSLSQTADLLGSNLERSSCTSGMEIGVLLDGEGQMSERVVSGSEVVNALVAVTK